MERRKLYKRLLKTAATVFIAMNALAAMYAYKFTHFTTDKAAKHYESSSQMTTGDKVKIAIMGLNYPRPVNAAKPRVPYETIEIKSNKRLECWLIKSKNAKGTVILFHGYAADKSKMLDKANEMTGMNYNTLLVDFMGSGGSEGNQTTIGFKEAEEVKACYDYILGTGEKNVYLFGTSMGAVAIMKAINDYHISPKGIIIECPFGTMYETVSSRFSMMHAPSFPMAGLLMFWGGLENGFWAFSHNPVTYAKQIKCPTLLMYGEKDDRVSRHETDDIFRNIQGTKSLHTFPGAGHNNYLQLYKEDWTEAISKFLAQNQ